MFQSSAVQSAKVSAGRSLLALLLAASVGGALGQEIEAQNATSRAQTGEDLAHVAGQDLIGLMAPSVVLQTIDGDSIDLSAVYGRQAIYLKFWASWCVPCREQMPHFQQVYDMAGPDLAVIGINAGFNDSVADIREVVQQDALTMPTVLDNGRLGATFNLRVTPQHIVIGRDGRIQYVGHFANEQLDEALRVAQFGLPPPDFAVGALSVVTPAVDGRYDVGNVLPDSSVVTLDGREFRLRNPAGARQTGLVFLSPWCESYLAASRPAYAASCRNVRQQIAALARTSAGVRWVGIASGLWATRERLREYELQFASQIPLVLDESHVWFGSFGVTHVPTIIVLDSVGRIVNRIEGTDAEIDTKIRRVVSN